MTTATQSRIETAEMLIVRLDEVQAELQAAESREYFESCKVQIVAIKAELIGLGYEVERCVTGWQLVANEQEEEVAQVASQENAMNAQEIIAEHAERFDGSAEQETATAIALIREGSVGTFYGPYIYKCLICGGDTHDVMRVNAWAFPVCKASYERIRVEAVQSASTLIEEPVVEKKIAAEDAKLATLTASLSFGEDAMGLYARVKSANPKKPTTVYTVRICARYLQSVECDCPASGDCLCRLAVDRALDGVRPTFSEQLAGVFPSRDTIEALLRGSTSRYDTPLNGSGVTGFRAKRIAQKLAA